ncbi:MAG: MFS transporter [Burkholderiales bacterium]|nr:MFS transporter [Burkholderiales bacterium]
MPTLPMAIYLTLVLIVLNHIAFGGSRVVITLFALETGASQMQVGILMALYALCPMLFAIAIGRLADRVGPRLPMLLGSAGLCVALLLNALWPMTAMLYIASFLLGTSFHFFFVTVTGIAGGIGGSENRSRNYALVSLGFSGAGFLGPLIAGFAIDSLGHRSAFMILAAFTVIPVLILLFRPRFLPGAVKVAGDAAGGGVMDLLRAPRLRNTFIASGFISAGWDLFNFYMPVYGHGLGLSATAIGTILGVFALATFVIRSVLPWLIRHRTEAQIMVYALFVAAGAFALFPLFSHPLALCAVAFLLGLGVGCGQPMSMSLIYTLAPKGRASEAAGLRVTFNNFTHLVIPLAFGSIGGALGFAPVWLANSVLLSFGGWLVRRGS